MCTCFQILLNAQFLLIIASDCGGMGYDAIKFSRWASVFQKDMPLPSSVDRGRMSEMLALLYPTTRCHIPENGKSFEVSGPLKNFKSCDKNAISKFKSCGMTCTLIYTDPSGEPAAYFFNVCAVQEDFDLMVLFRSVVVIKNINAIAVLEGFRIIISSNSHIWRFQCPITQMAVLLISR
jgi:hypothetical protein